MATCSMMTPPATELAAAPVEEARMVCPECNGGGRWWDEGWEECFRCKGTGNLSPDELLFAMAEAEDGELVEPTDEPVDDPLSVTTWLVKWGPFEWTEQTEHDARIRVEAVVRERGAFRDYVSVTKVVTVKEDWTEFAGAEWVKVGAA